MTFMGGPRGARRRLAARAAWKRGERPARRHGAVPPARAPRRSIRKRAPARPNYNYGYAAQAVEVEVEHAHRLDAACCSIVSAHDVGQARSTASRSKGQIEGCLAQALGYALLEHFQMRDGKVLTPYFSTYLLPTTLDMPTDITR